MKFLEFIKQFFFRTSSSQKVEKKMNNLYKTSIENAASQSGGSSLMAGVLVYSSLMKMYEEILSDKELFKESGLAESEYKVMAKTSLDKYGHSTLDNWDELTANYFDSKTNESNGDKFYDPLNDEDLLDEAFMDYEEPIYDDYGDF